MNPVPSEQVYGSSEEARCATDAFYRELIAAPEFNRPMSTAEFHYLVGKYLAERERLLGQRLEPPAVPPGGEAQGGQVERERLQFLGQVRDLGRRRGRHGAAAGEHLEEPHADQRQHAHNEQVGRHRKDPAGLFDAAQVCQRHQRDQTDRQLDAVGLQRANGRGDRGDGGRHADGHGQHVVDQQGRRGHQGGHNAEILARDDIGAAALRVGDDRLAVREGHGD